MKDFIYLTKRRKKNKYTNENDHKFKKIVMETILVWNLNTIGKKHCFKLIRCCSNVSF